MTDFPDMQKQSKHGEKIEEGIHMLHYFEEQNKSLIFRENGETVMVEPWGADSLRVRATFLGDIPEGSAALLDTENAESEVRIEIGEDTASITNGRIQAKLTVADWGKALQMTFYNQKGEILPSQLSV